MDMKFVLMADDSPFFEPDVYSGLKKFTFSFHNFINHWSIANQWSIMSDYSPGFTTYASTECCLHHQAEVVAFSHAQNSKC